MTLIRISVSPTSARRRSKSGPTKSGIVIMTFRMVFSSAEHQGGLPEQAQQTDDEAAEDHQQVLLGLWVVGDGLVRRVNVPANLGLVALGQEHDFVVHEPPR